MSWGRQVGLADDFGVGHHQLEGKGARFTIDEFRKLALRAGGWGETEARYEAQLVKYGEIRAEHQYKAWVLQWSVKVPVEKERGRERGFFRVIEEED